LHLVRQQDIDQVALLGGLVGYLAAFGGIFGAQIRSLDVLIYRMPSELLNPNYWEPLTKEAVDELSFTVATMRSGCLSALRSALRAAYADDATSSGGPARGVNPPRPSFSTCADRAASSCIGNWFSGFQKGSAP
jgi:hypothetical protein